MDKKHHPLDDLFRQGLSNLEIKPTETGRSAFLEKAGREITKRSHRTGWLTGNGIILGVALLTGAFLAILNTGEKQDHKNPKEKIQTNQTNNNAVSGANTAKPDFELTSHTNTIFNTKQNVHCQRVKNIASLANHATQTEFTALTEKESKDDLVLNTAATTSLSPVITASVSSLNESPSVTLLTPQKISSSVFENVTTEPQKPIDTDSLSKKSAQSGDSIINPAETNPQKEVDHHPSVSFHNREWNIRAGIYYTPEWIFNTLDNNKYVNNFGIEGQFRFGDYSVRTGIGLSITRGFNELIVETKPYLGGYNALDYITYHWDSKHYHLIPTLYTTWKEVYDTAIHKNYFTLEKEYTYLQIPMILGYDFFIEKWFSLGARVGPVMSLLLKTRELTSEYDAGKDQVISINNITPDRIHLNWQAIGGINASYRLSEFIIIELEPEIRYYFNSVYEKSSPSDKPWSIGIRGALLINF